MELYTEWKKSNNYIGSNREKSNIATALNIEF